MAGGRPSKLTDKVKEDARVYIAGGFEQCGDVIPSHVGLADYLGVVSQTLTNWGEDDAEFLGILEILKDKQHKVLVNKGLTSEFNSTITKLILTKHNYTDKVDQNNTGDQSMTITVKREVVDAKND